LNRELKKKTAELQEKINAVRNNLTPEQCEMLVMQLLHEGFVTELDKYLNAEVTKTVKAISGLWEKYHASATDLLAERKAAEDKLNGLLERLGYING
jgi:type I restriction enzyme M protein